MPEGIDTVFMQEDVGATATRVILPPGLKRGANRRLAGEDVARGTIGACRPGAASPAGHRARWRRSASPTCRCDAGFRVAVFSTGDEVVSPGEPLGPAKLYDANRFMLPALLERLGCRRSDLGILRDEPARA